MGPVTSVAVRIDEIKNTASADRLDMFGRVVARRFHYQQPVLMGQGVFVAEGGFYPEGGNRHHPTICPLPGTVLIIKDIDAGHFASITYEREPNIYSVVPEDLVEIYELENEREVLGVRIQKVNFELLDRYLAKEAMEAELWRSEEEEGDMGRIPEPEIPWY
jgi:hypothetical protein